MWPGLNKTDSELAFRVRFCYARDMRLMTPVEAARELYFTAGTILHHARQGNIKTYPKPGTTKRFLVDLDEVKEVVGRPYLDHALRDQPENMVTRKVAAERMKLTVNTIHNYVKKGYVQKHYLEGSDKFFLVDMNEVMEQPALADKRHLDRMKDPVRLEKLRLQALQQKGDDNGRFVKKEKA